MIGSLTSGDSGSVKRGGGGGSDGCGSSPFPSSLKPLANVSLKDRNFSHWCGERLHRPVANQPTAPAIEAMVTTVQTAARLSTPSQVANMPRCKGHQRSGRSGEAGSNKNKGIPLQRLCESSLWFPRYRKHHQTVAVVEVAQ